MCSVVKKTRLFEFSGGDERQACVSGDWGGARTPLLQNPTPQRIAKANCSFVDTRSQVSGDSVTENVIRCLKKTRFLCERFGAVAISKNRRTDFQPDGNPRSLLRRTRNSPSSSWHPCSSPKSHRAAGAIAQHFVYRRSFVARAIDASETYATKFQW